MSKFLQAKKLICCGNFPKQNWVTLKINDHHFVFLPHFLNNKLKLIKIVSKTHSTVKLSLSNEITIYFETNISSSSPDICVWMEGFWHIWHYSVDPGLQWLIINLYSVIQCVTQPHGYCVYTAQYVHWNIRYLLVHSDNPDPWLAD